MKYRIYLLVQYLKGLNIDGAVAGVLVLWQYLSVFGALVGYEVLDGDSIGAAVCFSVPICGRMNVVDSSSTASGDGRVYSLQIYPRLSSDLAQCCKLHVSKSTTAAEVIQNVAALLKLDATKCYVLAEVKECGGEEWVLEAGDLPVHRVLLWPRRAQEEHPQSEGFYFLLQERNLDGSIRYMHLPAAHGVDDARCLLARGFLPPRQQEVDDLCNLPNLTEESILANLRLRFQHHSIYTYAGSILIAINPFKFLPIYNPKYVKKYDNHQLGKLDPHIFAIADVAYHTMLKKQVNQCIVISGESGSGKTQSTNFLIHCLTALSQKGYASGVERTILGAGPVLEAFGNAKTAHNNNSSRFGKFIQVNYLESGIVRGAVVEKYLLEKSRLVSREKNERNYHVFYYLLLGASEEEHMEFKLLRPEDYFYLRQENFQIEDGEDHRHEFQRLKQAMEMVKQELLVEALTKRKTVTVNEKLILHYSLNEAVTARDSMAKSLYSALFDWIVLRINHALLNKRDMEESISCLSIGVLDIFGFEDFKTNSFEQFCINYANEQLQYYFNQHIFKLEQEEYQSEGITWHNIDYTDNVGCIQLISKKPTGLFYLLDEESNFPHATNETLLAKFKQQHEDNRFFVATPVLEPAFIIRHFAGKDFREKNTDYMRPDIVALLRSSDRAYIRELVGMDPVAMFRWSILRATIRGIAAFQEAGRAWAAKTAGVVRRGSRIPLGELKRANTPIEKMYRDQHAQIMKSIRGLQLDSEDPGKFLRSWRRTQQPRSHDQKNRTNKQKQLIPKNLLDSQSLKHIVSMTLYDRTTKALLHLHKKKKPPSISAQFQKELYFDEALVLQQLRYTGMLETVRIRRSGYSAKYTFQVFMKESERQRLQDILHNEVIQKIIFLQRWFRAILDRRRFQCMRRAAISIQREWRTYRFYQKNTAAKIIQTLWRVYRQRMIYQKQLQTVLKIQAIARGRSAREWASNLRKKKQEAEETERRLRASIQAKEDSTQPTKEINPINEVGRPAEQQIYQRSAKNEGEHQNETSSKNETARAAELQMDKHLGGIERWQPVNPTMDKTFPKNEVEQPTENLKGEKDRKTPLLSQKSLSTESIDRHPTNQEKRERRRQRGLEHDKLQNKLASSASLEEHVPNTVFSEKEPVRTDSKELDQYIYIEVKVKDSPGKKDGKPSPSILPRPNSLPLNTIASSETSCKEPSSPTSSALQRYSNQAELQNKAERWRERSKQEGGPQHQQLRPHPGESATLKLRRNCSIKISNVSEQWGDSKLCEISNSNELKELDEFLGNQVNDLRSRGIKLSEVENIFITATVQFRETLKSIYSVQKQSLSYKELLKIYKKKVVHLAGEKQKTEVQLVTNLFQSVLDGFIRREVKKGEVDPKGEPETHHFGISICSLASDKNPVPVVLQVLLEYVEIHGLYTEGIYRKSGTTNRMKELQMLLESDPTKVNLEGFPIHAIAGVLKKWLRDLPEPLMTFALYSDFLHAVDLPEKQEQVQTIYRTLGQLPPAHYSTLERLVFHLVRVAKFEESNRMSPNALAIVFAPCILRCPDNEDPLMSMKDVAKTTM
ncbi:MYO9B protein, partial [Polypterus senegalus]